MKLYSRGGLRLFCLFLILLFSLYSRASHIVGGEITYQCLGNNWYKVVLTHYRDCSGVPLQPTATLKIKKGNGTNVGTYTLNKGVSSFININQVGCGTPTPSVCIETADYTLDSVYLPPTPTGYSLFNQSCCRNYNVDNIINAWKVGATFQAVINGNYGGCNSSPYFTSLPPVVLPVNVPLSISAAAADPEGDSLYYEFCAPLDDSPGAPPFNSVPLKAGYSASYLLPSNPALSINPATGIITGTVTTAGKYSIAICVKEFKNGVYIGKIQRDYQFTVVQPWRVFGSISAHTDASCASSADGSATAAVGGGSGPYTYLWSDGQTTQTATNLAPGSYTVIISDNAGCGDTVTVTINGVAAFTANVANQTAAGCGNAGGGSATIAISGGQAPYTVTWPDNSTGLTNNNLTAGMHKVAITDAGGCSDTLVVNIAASSSNLNVSAQVTDVSCPGSGTGAIDLTVTSGSGPFTFIWNDGDTTEDRTALAAGNYWVKVIENGGCSDSLNFTVKPGSPMNMSWTAMGNENCAGSADGFLKVAVTKGVPPYTYQWSNGGSGDSIGGLSHGNYFVVVTDSVGCRDTLNGSITAPTPLQSSLQHLKGVSCNGASNGEIEVNASGGQSPYSYSWSNGANGNLITGLAGGSYIVNITDANGCSLQDTIVVNEPTALALAIKRFQNESCLGSDGAIELHVSGGQRPYNFSWSFGTGDSTISNLTAGSYTVNLTDASGCSTSQTYTITGAVPITISVDSVVATSCGNDNGLATISISGGVSPYNILWSNGATGYTASGLAAGTQNVTVTDSSGCSSTLQITIPNTAGLSAAIDSIAGPACAGQPNAYAALTINGGKPPYQILWSNGDTTVTTKTLASGPAFVKVIDGAGCSDSLNFLVPATDSLQISLDSLRNVSYHAAADGKIAITISGGTPPYNINWTNGSTVSTLNKLGGGSYGVTVTDSRACSISATYQLTEPDSLQMSLKSLTHASCHTSNDGEIALSVKGGTPPYTFIWNNGQTDSTATGLIAGTYVVSMVDAGGCGLSDTFTINSPAAINIQVDTVIAASCGQNNGGAALSISGGTAPYSILWSNGQTGTSCSALAAGSINAIVTDSAGCSDSISVNIPIIGGFTAVIDSSASPACPGSATGFASVSITGGSAPFSFTWSNGDTTSTNNSLPAGPGYVVISDASGCQNSLTFNLAAADTLKIKLDSLQNPRCYGSTDGKIVISITGGTAPYFINWTNGATISTLNKLGSGSYGVSVTDSRACSSSATFQLSDPDSLALALKSLSNAGCNGMTNGQIALSPAGGTAPYTISWSNGMTDSTITGLAAGSYTATLTDAAGCSKTKTYTISQNAPLSVSLDTLLGASCGLSNGWATISVQGGKAPYTFAWSNGASTDSIFNLAGGSYSVLVSDSAGCSDSLSVSIPSAGNLNLQLDSLHAVSCYGSANGYISVMATGGSAPYQFSWSNGSTGSAVSGLAGGTYTVTLTDGRGCTNSTSYTINEPDSLSIIVKKLTDESCSGSDGKIELSVSGGVDPYNFSWSSGMGDSTLSNISAGTYTLMLTDASGCGLSRSFNISAPAPILITADTVVAAACGGSNGSAAISISGGVAPYNVQWSNGQTGLNAANLPAGNLSVTVTDSNGCSASLPLSIPNAGGMSASIDSIAAPSCAGQPNGFASVKINGGQPPYQILWSNGDTNLASSSLSSGNVWVTISDSRGCGDSLNLIVPATDSLRITVDTLQNVSCKGSNDGKISISISGGTPPYNINWNNGLTISTLNKLGAGSYGVTVTDSRACSLSSSFTITEPDSLQLSLKSLTNVSCHGSNNGEIRLSAKGGTPPYTFNWSNGQSDSTAQFLFAGNYSLQLTDAHGCGLSRTFTITQPDSIGFSIDTVIAASCGNANGMATITPYGGTAPYHIDWNSGQTGTTADSLLAGLYTVLITDTNGCTYSKHVSIPAATPMLVTVDSVSAPSCAGGVDGYAVLSISGGVPPYTFNWPNGASQNNSNANLASGMDTVLISDNGGCTHLLLVNIPSRDSLKISLDSLQNPSCYGSTNGVLSISINGGSPPYTINWSTGDTASTLNKLGGGSYGVTVTDSRACSSYASYSLTEPDSLHISLKSLNDVSCNGQADGSISIGLSGGTAPYGILWNNGQNDSILSAVGAGTYTAVITDAAGCSAIHSFTISEPIALHSQVDTIISSSCGQPNGRAAVSVSGGTAPYIYSWDNGGSSAVDSNLTSGIHALIITDAHGCSDSLSINIPATASLLAMVDSVSAPLCAGSPGGYAHVNVSGGTPPYNYAWINGNNAAANAQLLPGNGYVLVSDARGCSDSLSFVVPDRDSLKIHLDSIKMVQCHGEDNAYIEISVSGGVQPYTVDWGNNRYGKQLQNAKAGVQSVTVTDANGCSVSSQYQVYQPDTFYVMVDSVKNVSCQGSSDGAVYLRPSGNNLISNIVANKGKISFNNVSQLSAGKYSIWVENSDGCGTNVEFEIRNPTPIVIQAYKNVSPRCGGSQDGIIELRLSGGNGGPYTSVWDDGDTNMNRYDLSAGSHTVNITDHRGCSANKSFYVAPKNMDFSYSIGETSCSNDADGQLQLSASGARAPYQFLLNGNPVYDKQGIKAGNYTLTLIDADSCTFSRPIQVEPKAGMKVFFANAFTPNNDGLNDEFEIKGNPECLTNARLEIYNRWGNMIFSTDHPFEEFWDGMVNGEPAKADIYVYSFSSNEFQQKGYMNVLR